MTKTSQYLPTFLFLSLGFSLSKSLGHYRAEYVLFLTVLSLVVWGFFCLTQESTINTEGWNKVFLRIALSACTLRLLEKPLLLEPEANHAWMALRWALAIASLSLVLFFTRKHLRLGFIILAVALCLARIFVPFVSPSPSIDVFTNSTMAVDWLLKGVHPYAASYPDIYHGASGYAPGYLYPAGVFLGTVPAFSFLGDIRFSMLLADLGIAFMVYKISQKSQREENKIWALLWLAFPVSLLILDRSWVDTLLIFWLACGIRSWLQRRWTLTGLCFGLALSTKQYAIFFPLFASVVIAKKESLSQAFRFWVTVFLVVLFLHLPFLSWDFKATYRSLVEMPLAQPIRWDSFSLLALLYHTYNITLSSILILGAYGLGALLVILKLWQHPSVLNFLRGSSAYYLLVFLLGRQAFCNYYQLIAGCVVLWGALTVSAPSDRNSFS